VALSATANAGPATAPAPVTTPAATAVSRPSLIVRIGQTIEHIPGIVWNDLSAWWNSGGKQEVDQAVATEIGSIGINMLENLADGGKFNAQADAINGTFTALHSLEGTGQALSPGAISSFVSDQIPDDPKVAAVVSGAITQSVQTAVAQKGITKDQAIEITANTLQSQVTAAQTATAAASAP
jgi:hypothetical protein